MIDLDSAVSRLQQSYAAAAHARDVQAFMRLYDPKVRVFDAWGIWQHDGADAWQRAVEGWFSSLGAERVRVRFAETRSFGTPELAFSSALVTYAAVSAAGEELRVMDNRLTWGLRTSGHAMRILHEHTSAPVGFDDMKAILQRSPPAVR